MNPRKLALASALAVAVAFAGAAGLVRFLMSQEYQAPYGSEQPTPSRVASAAGWQAQHRLC